MFEDFIAGWLAGGMGLLVGHPLDTVKVRLQTIQYSGIFDCLRTTFRNESVMGLYKGMLTPFMTVGFLHSVLFVSYGLTLRILHPNERNIEYRKDLPMIEIILASLTSAVVQWVPAVPVEVIKTKLQIQRQNVGHFWEAKHHVSHDKALYQSASHCGRRLLSEKGIRGLYQGGQVQLLRDMIGFSFYIPVYEFIYRHLCSRNDTLANVIAGGTAGSLSWLSICPLDVVKSRLQAQSFTKPIYRNAFHCARLTYDEHGVRGFYKGGLVLTVRGFPVNAVLFVCYANSRAFLEKF